MPPEIESAKIDPTQPIGERPMSVFEMSDMNLLNLPEAEARRLSPQELSERTDHLVDDTNFHLLLGS